MVVAHTHIMPSDLMEWEERKKTYMMLSTILVALFKEFNSRLILLQRITNTINELTLRAICIRPSSKETSRNFCKGKYWSRIYRNYNHPEQIPSQDLGRHLVEEKQKHRHSHHDQSIPMKWTNTRGNILVWIWRKYQHQNWTNAREKERASKKAKETFLPWYIAK